MRISTLVLATAALLAVSGAPGVASAQSLGSAITYQGMFGDNGSPANGTYDFEFALYSVASGGTAVQTVTTADVAVNGGLINTLVDFGAATYDGQVKWIEVHARPGASTGSYTVLSPRQALTAAPYAMGLPMPFVRNTSVSGVNTFQINSLTDTIAIEGDIPVGSTHAAVYGVGPSGAGVQGVSTTGTGTVGISTSGTGVLGQSADAAGLGINGTNTLGTAIRGKSDGNGDGVRGVSTTGNGINGFGDVGGSFTGGAFGIQALNTGTCQGGGQFCVSTLQLVNQNGGELITAAGIGVNNWVFRVNGNGEVFANGGFQASGADLAEHVPSVAKLEAGDVVEIDAENGGLFQLSSHSNSTAVAGVISTKPGVTLNGSESGKDEAGMARLALSGRVPVKATSENGAIHAGDLLVSSSRPGHAMRAPESPRPGTVIGKAIQKLDRENGEIEMLVMLR